MSYNAYGWLTTCPVSDCNYKAALERATNEELERAVQHLTDAPGGNKGRITACQRELRKRERKAD